MNLNPARLPIPSYPHTLQFYHSPVRFVNLKAVAVGGEFHYNNPSMVKGV